MGYKHRELIRGSDFKRNKYTSWISDIFNLSNIFKTHMKQDMQYFWVTISRREKDGAQPIILYMVYLIMVDMSFSWSNENYVWFSAKFNCWTLFQEIPDATNMVIYHVVTIKNQRKKVPWFSFTFSLVIK